MKSLKKYMSPDIQQIKLDNEISLVLSSLEDAPFGPGELLGHNQAPEYFNQNSVV
jgi:hypothetical protein